MNKLNHIIACVGEEAGEISQAVGKIQRFGINYQHGKNTTLTELFMEFTDLLVVMWMLLEELDVDVDDSFEVSAHATTKKVKVLKFMEMAKNLEDQKCIV